MGDEATKKCALFLSTKSIQLNFGQKLGIGVINYSEDMMVAAMPMAEKNECGQLS